jgi:2-oxoglutarate dehydrogenase E2 component (dihydrolipoamide succinyltransferase)
VGQTIAIIETEGGEMVAVVKSSCKSRGRCRSNKVDAAKDSVQLQLISLILINSFLL